MPEVFHDLTFISALRLLAAVEDPRWHDAVSPIHIEWPTIYAWSRDRHTDKSTQLTVEIAASLYGHGDAHPDLSVAPRRMDDLHYFAFQDALYLAGHGLKPDNAPARERDESQATNWVRFSLTPAGLYEDVERLELSADQLADLVDGSHATGHVGGALASFVVTIGDGLQMHYVREGNPGTPARQPDTPASATAARLRALASAVERLEIPGNSSATIHVCFENIAPLPAAKLANSAADAFHDSATVTGIDSASASWYGNLTVPPVRIEFLHPDPADSVYCENCGVVTPREDLHELRRAAQQPGAKHASDDREVRA